MLQQEISALGWVLPIWCKRMDCFGGFFFVSQNSPLIFGENQSRNGVWEAKKMSGKKGFVLVYYAPPNKKTAQLKRANNVFFYMH